MDYTEALAQRFLEELGFRNLQYEPDGNVPPDFLLDDGTAVEVRQLNQIYFDEHGTAQGLDNANIPLWRTMKELLDNYESSSQVPTTVGVFYHFSRPIPARRVIARELKAELDEFLAGNRDTGTRWKLPCGIWLRYFDWKVWKGTPFRLAGNLDAQRGGMIVQLLSNAIRHSLAEKDAKILNFKNKYPRWWLVLVDNVSFGTDENDRRQLRETGSFAHTFDKVFIVNSQRIDDYFELDSA